MSFLNNIFGNSNSSNIFFETLESESQFDRIDVKSADKPQLIFKHSTRCMISKSVLRKFKIKMTDVDKYDIYYLDILAHGNLSDAISQRYGIAHESPQLIQIENGKATKYASHYKISDLVS